MSTGSDRQRPEGRPGQRRATPWLLRQVNQRYAGLVATRLRETQLDVLPRPGYWLLMALSTGAADATGLVGTMGVTKQAVSKTVDTLVAEGFVARQPNEADRRRTDLLLTEKGTKTVEVIRAALGQVERDFVREVGAAAWEATVTTLGTLARHTPEHQQKGA